MANENRDDEPKRARVHEVGQDLSTLSVFELDERIMELEAEIARIRTVRAAKDQSKEAAAAFFKR